ncbi:MAG: J domain-containing protein [Actinomycetota bacterium]|nr:J domain-containing protein [Actinomycetota bacterium]
MPTHYEVLGIPEGASDEEVRHAYRRLVKAAHPDRAGDVAQFRLITQAYEVLSDPAQRAAYDRNRGFALAGTSPRRRFPYGRYAVLLVATVVVGGVVWLAVVTMRQSVGDDCLVGTWRGEPFEVPFRGYLDGKEIAVPIRGGAGVMLIVAADGTVRADYAEAAPLAGAEGAYRVEGVYAGTTTERWRAAGGRVGQSATDASDLAFRATINGRAPDRPLALTVVDREYPYTCTATTLTLGPYRFTRTQDRRGAVKTRRRWSR